MMAALHKGMCNDERWDLQADGTCFWASGEMMPLKPEEDKVIGFIKILPIERRSVSKQSVNA